MHSASVDTVTVEAAQKQLTKLPLDRIPELATLPRGSRMPFTPNAHFVGRKKELHRLASILKGEHGTAAIGQMVAATGLGGIGKTQLAVEFAHRYGHYFAGGVFWLDFSAAAGVSNEVARCGGAEGINLLDGFDNLPLPDQVSLVQRAWKEPLPRLLIFDNCEEEELVDQWRPTTGGCRVLITSRRGEWDVARAISQVRLDTLTPAESARLLANLAPRLTNTEKQAIAEALGHFPLALHLAGCFLKRYKRVGANRYLQELEQAPLCHPSLVGRGKPYSPTQHEQHVARTFALSWQRLDENDPIDQLAQQLLLHAAYFAPNVPISPDLLQLTLPQAPRLSEYDYEDAQYRLVELGLLDNKAPSLIIHRLVAAFAHMEPQQDETRQRVEQALLNEAKRLIKAGYPAPLQVWQTHLRHLADVAQQREDEVAAGLCNAMGYHLQIVGDYESARPYYERALTIRRNVFGQQHPDTAQSFNNLGMLFKAMGQYERARSYYERALVIRQNVLGQQHPDTAQSFNHIGVLFRMMGQYESARLYYERALAIYEKALGQQHLDTAQSLNNLGVLFRVMGKYESAHPYYERALTIRRNVFGQQHPDTAQSFNNLGMLFKAMGQYERARSYYERALSIRQKVLGQQHPDTAQSFNNLGVLFRVMGQYESAHFYYERALTIRQKVLGQQHPDTVRSFNNLGALFYAMGQYENACLYLERTLAIRQKVLGEQHPDTAQSLNNLGALFYAQRQYKNARRYYEHALAIRQKVLGEQHPDTAQSLNNLGNLLSALGEYESARPYLEGALVIYEQQLGADHADTALSLNNLGKLFQKMGQYESARPYLERALAIFEQRLGADHPTTKVVRGNLQALGQG